MSISPITQVAKVAQVSSQNTADVSTTITSPNSTVSQLSSAITQLQSHGGSASQIQKLQQAMQTAKNQILKQEQSAEVKKASEQSANIQAAVKSNRGLDVQA
jgi:hypothetical protein